jgi:hypothetical protein
MGPTAMRATALALVCAAGCGNGDEFSADPPLLVHRLEGEMDAEVSGYLGYMSRPHCFILASRADGGGERYPVVWPSGTRLAHDHDEVVGVEVPGFGDITVGDWVSGGGGYLERAGIHADLPEVSPECLGDYAEYAVLDRILEASAAES